MFAINVQGPSTAKVAGAIALVMSFPLITIWRGFVLSTLWHWFAASPFGLPALGIAHASGISLLIALVVYRRLPHDPEATSWLLLSEALSIPAFAIAFGWLLKQFI